MILKAIKQRISKKRINLFCLFFSLIFFFSCNKDGDVFLRVENLRDFEIENLKIGNLEYGNIKPNETSEYKQINTGTFTASYTMNGRDLAGEVETWGADNLKMQIQNNGELVFIDE